MIAYNKGDLIPEGTRVRVWPSTAPFSGLYGTVVPNGIMGRRVWSLTNPGTRLTYVKLDYRDTVFGCHTNNLERIEDMNTRNLVGPKPEPVQEPDFPTPWRADGANVLDANDKVVFRIQFGGYHQDAYRSELPVATKYALAQEVVKAVNKFHEKVDSSSPF